MGVRTEFWERFQQGVLCRTVEGLNERSGRPPEMEMRPEQGVGVYGAKRAEAQRRRSADGKVAKRLGE